jgi:hypothetical protein
MNQEVPMEVIHTHCAGLDVHRKVVVAAIIVPVGASGLIRETRFFGSMTANLLGLSAGQMSHRVTHLAMESTGEYWNPLFNILEENFEDRLGQRRTYQQSSWTQDGYQRNGMD